MSYNNPIANVCCVCVNCMHLFTNVQTDGIQFEDLICIEYCAEVYKNTIKQLSCSHPNVGVMCIFFCARVHRKELCPMQRQVQKHACLYMWCEGGLTIAKYGVLFLGILRVWKYNCTIIINCCIWKCKQHVFFQYFSISKHNLCSH